MTLKPDSGASAHFIRKSDKDILTNLKTGHGPSVMLPDMTTINATQQGSLHIPMLSPRAKQAHVLPKLKSASLLSLGQLCDDDCEITLTKHDISVKKNEKTILHGQRNQTDGLWDIKFTKNPLQANVIIRKNMLKKDLITFLHGACFSPCPTTFTKAIKNGNFITWPGLTPELVTKFLPTSVATVRGHLKQERQHLQSTRIKATQDNDDSHFPPSDEPNVKTNDVIYAILDYNKSGKAYGDLTGKFPVISSRGTQYFLVSYHYDANAIYAICLKNRTANEITKAYMTLHKMYRKSGNAPHTFILDNEISKSLLNAFERKHITYQLVPPHVKRRNMAERSIQIWKDHFLSGLASLPPDFPIGEFDRLVFQANLTLNLLRNARLNPRLSSWAFLFGNFDYNATPIAPPGTKVVFHNKPGNRSTWDMRGDVGYYIGPSMHHYRCIKVYKPKTRQEIDTDTVTFIPHKIPIPQFSTNDYLQQACEDIVEIIQKPPDNLPHNQAGDETKNALLKIAKALKQAVAPPPTIDAQARPVPQPSPPPRVHKGEKRRIGIPRILQQHGTPFKRRAAEQLQFLPIWNAPPINPTITNKIYVQHIFDPQTGQRETIDTLRNKYPQLWEPALSNEWGRLSDGNDAGVKGTNTIEFIVKSEVPDGRDVTYASFVCDHRPLKPEPYRVRIVVGGDKLSYDNDAASPAASLIETKLILNSTISDAKRGAKFFTADIKDFFLATPMAKPEFMKVPLKYFPADIVRKYNLHKKVSKDGLVYIRIIKGMYGLKQAAVLAYNQLVTKLQPFGYYPVPNTNGLWRHHTRKTRFCLCVDDFGIKSFNNDDTQHILNALRASYKISTDMKGENYCGLTIRWNYDKGFVDISMPNYIKNLLHKLQHRVKVSPQCAPHTWTEPAFGKTRQYAKLPSTLPILDKQGKRYVQSVVGSLLYYSRAIDVTMLPALNEIAAEQAKPTKETLQRCQRVLDYAATYPDSKIRYLASDMIMYVDSDAAYLVQPNARSRIAGHYTLGTHTLPPPSTPTTPQNGPFHTECKTLRHVVASAAEAETGGLFHNGQMIVALRHALDALDHPQPPTPLKTDNSTSYNFVHRNIRQKKSKSWDMRYNWLRDRERMKQLRVYWQQGAKNLADYFTKHFPPSHHRNIRYKYLLKAQILKNALTFSNCACEGVLKQRYLRYLSSPRSCAQMSAEGADRRTTS